MKAKSVLAIAGLSLVSLVPVSAFAHADVSVSLGFGGYAPGYATVYSQPAYVEPAPIYYPAPRPVYYGVRGYAAAPAYVGYRGYYRDEDRHCRDRERHDRRWRGDRDDWRDSQYRGGYWNGY
ncbi:hypothetical protein SAMN04488038_11426 [Solimonas aquatica]|uniref:PXPV repeat-containing protein n=1 Tax=Solimonas aquatica TaxID=489703 RepID=A0A1H9KSN5_9GAMM|nr:hypothetical protein [Solimonas aquatica]SER02204.1 hypothetical protein SAMN04488038_11426 [Solimonas aquatica]